MIGLDTNVLVRYLTQDDPGQSLRATELIERRLTEDNPGFISVVAMTETVWVLERAYRLSNVRIAEVIERLLQTAVLVVENEAEVFAAMTVLQEGSGSFADSLIGELGDRAGCSVTLTFDQKASRLRNFVLA
jgi:predicted nucleic-acid-binding protein